MKIILAQHFGLSFGVRDDSIAQAEQLAAPGRVRSWASSFTIAVSTEK